MTTTVTRRADTAPAWREVAPSAAELSPRRHARRRRLIERTLAVAVPVALIAVWQVLADAGVIHGNYFPAPVAIFDAWIDIIRNGIFVDAVAASLRRIALGYLLGCVSALVLGLLIGSLRIVRVALEPTISALYTVPKLSILPLLLLVFGLGELSKVLLVALTCFFVVLINTIDAVGGVPARYTDVGRSCRAPYWAMLWHITLPAALPQMLTGLRIASGLAVIVIVGAEFVAANTGLGFLTWNSWNLGVPEYMYVGIAAISIIGVLANLLLRGVEWLLTPWKR